MADTSTLQPANNLRLQEGLSSLVEQKTAFDNLSPMGGRKSTPHILSDSFGNHTVFYAKSPRDAFLSYHRTDGPLFPESKGPESIVPSGILWSQIPNARSWIERSPVEGSNHGLVWRCSYDPSLQGRRTPGAFAMHTGEASGVLAKILTDVEGTIAKEWAALFDHVTKRREVVVDSRGQERLAARLRASFEADSVEDGIGHQAEDIIGEALRSANDQRVLHWFREFCTDSSQPSFAASILRCLGRHEHVGTVSWRVGLLRDGLAMDSVEIRDAAVQAAESWGDSDLLEVLNSHFDPEPWLRQYILDVIDDLSG